MPHIQSIVPELPSLDLTRTRAFYESKLGFKTVNQYDDYIIFERDGIWINYWLCHDPELPKSSSCYIYVDDAKALYEELKVHQIIHPQGTLRDQPYGVRDFKVLDDNGCLLKFGQRLNRS
jgi:catechol 2,3-dioxygenase-like lactoylglutathione lyase family enzyme